MNAQSAPKVRHPPRRRQLGPVALLLFAVSSMTWAASQMDTTTQPVTSDIYHRGEIIDRDELAQMRGGFNIGGMHLTFGITLTSLLNNHTQYQTVINLTKAGPKVVSQTLNNPSGATLVGPGTGTSVVDLTPLGINLQGLANYSGVVVSNQQGFSALLHNVTRRSITSATVSNASGQAFDNRIDITVEVHNLSQIRAAQQREAIMRSLNIY